MVFEAADGHHAVRRARTWLPDLIILNLGMPPLDGFGAIAELRSDARFRDTPIVALTGGARDKDHERAPAVGFTAWMPKPVRGKALRAGVGLWLG